MSIAPHKKNAGLLRRITVASGLCHGIGKEFSRFEQGEDDFIENIDVCIPFGGGRVAANGYQGEVSGNGKAPMLRRAN